MPNNLTSASEKVETAEKALLENDYEAARLRLLEALRYDSQDSSIHHLLGLAHAGLGDFHLSVLSLKAALLIEPNNQKYLGYLSQFEAYRDYQLGVLERRNSIYLQYPPLVHIETFTKCNADCSFCPYASLERLGTKMSDNLISKIIDDLTDIPQSVSFTIAPQKVNEPFLDKRIFDIFGEIYAKLPNARLSLNSNGAALTDTNIKSLSKVRNIGRMWISLNDHRAKVYGSLMKLSFNRTINRLDKLHDEKQAGNIPFPVQIGKVRDYTTADIEFSGWVRDRYPSFEVGFISRGDWAGQVSEKTLVTMAIGCQRWFDLSITSTGKVVLCCMDGRAEHIIGDVTNTNALDIYNGTRYRYLREHTLDRTRAENPCNTCSFM